MNMIPVPESSKAQLAQVFLVRGTPGQKKEALDWMKKNTITFKFGIGDKVYSLFYNTKPFSSQEEAQKEADKRNIEA